MSTIPILLVYSVTGTLSCTTPNALGLGPIPVATQIRGQPLLSWVEVRKRARGLIRTNDVVFVHDNGEWCLIEGDHDFVKPSRDGILTIKFIPAAVPRGNVTAAPSPPTATTTTTTTTNQPSRMSSKTSSAPSTSSSHRQDSQHHSAKRDPEVMLLEAAEAAKKMSSLLGSTISMWAKQAGETAVTLGEVAQQRMQHQHEDMVGSIRIRIGKKLAEGGFSEVFHARNAVTNEALALKRCRAQTREQLDQLKREIKAHQVLLDEDHILKLYASDQQDGGSGGGGGRWVIRLLFPLCEGGSWIDCMNNFSEQDHLRVLVGVARGLQAMHDHHLLHRDVKPHNVLLTGTGHPLLMDLGSSCASPISVSTKSAASLLVEDAGQHCSAPYRAPELYEPKIGEDLGPEIDVWSLGASLYAVTYGKGYSPFEDATQGVLKLAILNGTPIKFPGTSKFSDIIKRIVLSALARQGHDRITLEALIDMVDG